MGTARMKSACCGLVLMIAAPAMADTLIPLDRPPDICDLAVAVDPMTRDVTVTWSGGTPPFVVVRSDRESFRDDEHLDVLAMTLSSREYVDPAGRPSGGRRYYQVYDVNSGPKVYGFFPNAGLPGSQVRVRGTGFPSDCEDITVFLGGSEAPTKRDCSFTGFTFEVPPKSHVGYLVIVTPGGATVAGGLDEEEMCHGKPRHPVSW